MRFTSNPTPDTRDAHDPQESTRRYRLFNAPLWILPSGAAIRWRSIVSTRLMPTGQYVIQFMDDADHAESRHVLDDVHDIDAIHWAISLVGEEIHPPAKVEIPVPEQSVEVSS